MKKASHYYYNRRLNDLLSCAPIDDFLQMIWDLDALQSDLPGSPKISLIDAPEKARVKKIGEGIHIPKWWLETLAIRRLATNQQKRRRGRKARILNCRRWGAAARCLDTIRSLEGAHDVAFMDKYDVIRLMGLIAHRQFPWQRGVLNTPHVYRNAFVYGGEEATIAFKAKSGLTFSEFLLLGFTSYVAFVNQHRIDAQKHFSDPRLVKVGLTPQIIERGLNLLAQNFTEASNQAVIDLREAEHIGYARSTLRDRPILKSTQSGVLICPLPTLILTRSTSGVFYDIVDSDRARRECGERFESYCLKYISCMAPSFHFTSEISYGTKKNPRSSPDILGKLGNKIRLIIECKSRRIPFRTKFENHDIANLDSAYDEIIKGVIQIWRFVYDIRADRVGKHIELSKAAVGCLLTLDNWLEGSPFGLKRLYEKAHEKADSETPPIPYSDRIPISLVAIEDLENTLGSYSEEAFLEGLDSISTGEKFGWSLHDAVKNSARGETTDPRYPFAKQLPELMPWWDNF